jgi:hypothetical protein
MDGTPARILERCQPDLANSTNTAMYEPRKRQRSERDACNLPMDMMGLILDAVGIRCILLQSSLFVSAMAIQMGSVFMSDERKLGKSVTCCYASLITHSDYKQGPW